MTDDYEVGYSKPPKSGQFKKGQSGNPKGRPKGSKNIPDLYRDLLEEKVAIKENGEKKIITCQRAIARRVRADALQGKDKAIDRMLEHAPKNKDQEVRYTYREWLDVFLDSIPSIELIGEVLEILKEMDPEKSK